MKPSNTQSPGPDIGHLFIVGPTGVGKSRSLASTAIQFQRRQAMRVGTNPPTRKEKDVSRGSRDEGALIGHRGGQDQRRAVCVLIWVLALIPRTQASPGDQEWGADRLESMSIATMRMAFGCDVQYDDAV